MNPSDKIWYAYIAVQAYKYFADAQIPCERVIKMLWNTAEMRSGFDAKYCDDDCSGFFALPQPVFEEMKRRLDFDKNVSPFDPVANIEAAVAYIAWLFEKYAEFVPDENERLKIALLALDSGYFRVKFALEKCRKPVVLEQVAAITNCCETGKCMFKTNESRKIRNFVVASADWSAEAISIGCK